MKWFRHMSDASDDEFIAALEAEFGDSGYAWWWKMIERIAKQMDETDRCEAEYPIAQWMIFLRIKRQQKLQSFLEKCAKSGKISFQISGNFLKIKCPKLLELRDEHTRKLRSKSGVTPGAAPEKVAPEVEVEVESIEQESSTEKQTKFRITGERENETGDPPAASKNLTVRFIQAFDEAGRAVYGRDVWDGHRLVPAGTDLQTAKRIEATGATPEQLQEFCESRFAAIKAKNQFPQRPMAYYERAFGDYFGEIRGLAPPPPPESDERKRAREERRALREAALKQPAH